MLQERHKAYNAQTIAFTCPAELGFHILVQGCQQEFVKKREKTAGGQGGCIRPPSWSRAEP